MNKKIVNYLLLNLWVVSILSLIFFKNPVNAGTGCGVCFNGSAGTCCGPGLNLKSAREEGGLCVYY